MILSVASILASENNSPRFPFKGTTRLSMTAAFLLIFCHIFSKEASSFSKFACKDSPGETFCLQTRNAECNTAYRQ